MLSADPLLVAIGTIAGATAIGWVIARLLAPRQPDRVEPMQGGAARDGRSTPASWTSGLARTRGGLARRLLSAFAESGPSGEWANRIEEVLLSSDVGVSATRLLLDRWRKEIGRAGTEAELRGVIRDGIRELLVAPQEAIRAAPSHDKPRVIFVVGVNGVGKTTTIGKLAHRFRGEGKKVLLVAGDTFRAAAVEQLTRWAERSGCDLVKHQHGADPSAVVFDGIKAAKARAADVVVVDTAGRLHVKANLMEELKKMARTAGREMPGAPHEVLLVIDATTGQNALNQARVFHEAMTVDGVVLTKLDGTARGGIALAIGAELGLPIRYVGLGEGIDDLAAFDAAAFAEALVAAEA